MGSRAGAARAGAAAALTMSRGAKPRGDRMAKARVASIETRTARADARMVGSEARGTQRDACTSRLWTSELPPARPKNARDGVLFPRRSTIREVAKPKFQVPGCKLSTM